MKTPLAITLTLAAVLVSACQSSIEADVIIENGLVFIGDNTPGQPLSLALKNGEILYVGKTSNHIAAARVIDASGLYVLPGFIDPHTHSLGELNHDDAEIRENRNYQFQGVTTVMNGNDGFGEPDITDQIKALDTHGIGTNTALFIGHGALRKSVMGGDKRAPSTDELLQMELIISEGMEAGALGLSTGLFYAPGSFSDTDEVIALAKIAAKHGGIYDSHIRDEATYNIGIESAIEEVITIAREANIPANIAHIKALGVDVWGKSETLISMIEEAQAEGLIITADQYPWQASGTRISNALIPRWVKVGTDAEYKARLEDPRLREQIIEDTTENLRKRGGAEAVLITQKNPSWQGKTLKNIAEANALSPVEMAIQIARQGDARIASFNMDMTDIENFMVQDWVMTSSDGSTGHPRKYASFPKKYRDYVIDKSLMPIETYFYRSSGMVADTFGLCDRGYLKKGYAADIAILNPETFAPKADFQNADTLSVGIEHLFVNGQAAISETNPQSALAGRALKRCTSGEPYAQ